jgi:hypothetical protein
MDCPAQGECMIHAPTCPVCDSPARPWLIIDWGICLEMVCMTCGLWATRMRYEHRRKA